jgi:hypothetical protein
LSTEAAAIGAPQFGQVGALSETSFEHSGHLISAIAISSLERGCSDRALRQPASLSFRRACRRARAY